MHSDRKHRRGPVCVSVCLCVNGTGVKVFGGKCVQMVMGKRRTFACLINEIQTTTTIWWSHTVDIGFFFYSVMSACCLI